MWRTYHALAVGGNAFGQDCVAQFLETLLWITRRGSFEQQHVQIRHFGELAMKGLDSLTIRNSGWGLRMAVCTDLGTPWHWPWNPRRGPTSSEDAHSTILITSSTFCSNFLVPSLLSVGNRFLWKLLVLLHLTPLIHSLGKTGDDDL